MNKHTGTLFVFLAALLYSIGGLCIKVIPWSGMSINGGRTAIALVVLGVYLAVIRHRPRFNRWVFLGSLCIFGTNTLFSLANKLTTAANTIVLQFTAPVFVILFSALFWKKKPQKLDLAACAVVFGGVLFFFVDSLEAGGALGNVLAVLSGAAYGGVFLLNDFPDADAISAVFWGDVLSAVTGLPFLLQETVFTPTALTSLVILGVFQVAVAYILLTIGLRTTPPGLGHRAGAEPPAGGRLLRRDGGALRPGGGGHRHLRRGGLQRPEGPAARALPPLRLNRLRKRNNTSIPPAHSEPGVFLYLYRYR